MHTSDSSDREHLRAAARQFLDRNFSQADVRRLMETAAGYDATLWRRMTELGWQGLAIPTRHGGAGFGWAELAVVLEEMGRVLLCAPFFSCVALAATALIESDDEDAQARYLPGIASGDLVATLAITGDGGAPDAEGVGVTAARAAIRIAGSSGAMPGSCLTATSLPWCSCRLGLRTGSACSPCTPMPAACTAWRSTRWTRPAGKRICRSTAPRQA